MIYPYYTTNPLHVVFHIALVSIVSHTTTLSLILTSFHLDYHTLIFCYYPTCFVWSEWYVTDRWCSFVLWWSCVFLSCPSPFTCLLLSTMSLHNRSQIIVSLYSIRPQLFYNLVFLVLSSPHTHPPTHTHTHFDIHPHMHTHAPHSPCLVVVLLFYSLYMMRFLSTRNIVIVFRIVESLCSSIFDVTTPLRDWIYIPFIVSHIRHQFS